MLERNFISEVEKEINHVEFPFFGFLIAVTSLVYSVFNLYHDGLVSTLIAPQYRLIPEDVLSWLLLMASVIKIIGVIFNHSVLKRIGIVILSGLWGILFLISITYSFGIGYPNSRFITTGFIVIACMRVSFKGDFD